MTAATLAPRFDKCAVSSPLAAITGLLFTIAAMALDGKGMGDEARGALFAAGISLGITIGCAM
jgi:hypothetical protein